MSKNRKDERRPRRTGSYTKRGEGSYRLQARIDGRRFRTTVRAANDADAEDALRDFISAKKAELNRGFEPGETGFSDLVAHFERDVMPELRTEGTRESYSHSLKTAARFFVDELLDPPVEKIRKRHIKAFVRWRSRTRVRGKGRPSPYTVNKDLRTIHRLFAYAVEELEVIETNPAAGVKGRQTDKRTPPILTPEQYTRLLEECADRPMLRTYVALLAEAGLRSDSEASRLEWEDVDLSARTLSIRSAPGRRTKTGQSRRVPITPLLDGILRDHFARYRFATYDGKPTPYVFHHEVTANGRVAGACIKSFRKAFATAAKRAELPEDFRRHDLRHRRATVWIAEGRNPAHVQAAMGHSNIATTMLYTHLADEHVDALLAPAPNPLRDASGA